MSDTAPHNQSGSCPQPPEDLSGKYQVAHIYLSDGRKIVFVGPAVIPDSQIERIRVVRLELTKPEDMPPGASFVQLKDL